MYKFSYTNLPRHLFVYENLLIWYFLFSSIQISYRSFRIYINEFNVNLIHFVLNLIQFKILDKITILPLYFP